MKRHATPLGAPLNTPDEELDLLALVTLEDIEDAKATARQRMTDIGAALLESPRVTTDDDGTLV